MCLFPLQPCQQLYYQTWGNVCQFEMVSLWSFNLNWTSRVKLQVFSYVFHLYFPLCKRFVHDFCSVRLLDFSQCLFFFLIIFKAIISFFLATVGLRCSASSFSSCNEWELFVLLCPSCEISQWSPGSQYPMQKQEFLLPSSSWGSHRYGHSGYREELWVLDYIAYPGSVLGKKRISR